MKYDLSNKDESAALYVELAKLMMGKVTVELNVSKKTRTPRQNSALHTYFGLLAQALSDAGLDMKKTLKADAEIPWTADTVKEFLWRPVMKAQLGKTSTTELSTKQIDEVYETLNRHLGDKFGVSVLFPSVENK